jgi:hypothetical protein
LTSELLAQLQSKFSSTCYTILKTGLKLRLPEGAVADQQIFSKEEGASVPSDNDAMLPDVLCNLCSSFLPSLTPGFERDSCGTEPLVGGALCASCRRRAGLSQRLDLLPNWANPESRQESLRCTFSSCQQYQSHWVFCPFALLPF